MGLTEIRRKQFTIYTFVTMLSLADMWSGSMPASKRFHMRLKSFSRPWAYCLQSNRGLSTRATHTLARMAFKNSRSVPRRMAMSWYSWRFRAINSGHPSVVNWDAATLKPLYKLPQKKTYLIWWVNEPWRKRFHRHRHDGRPRPQDVHAGCMTVAQWRIQAHIGQLASSNVLLLGSDIGEDYSARLETWTTML